MAQVMRPKSAGGGSLFATDGRSHPLQDSLMGVTLVLGLLAFATCWINSLHVLSSWAGLAGIFVGAYGQYVSVTTRERFLIILGLGAAGIGFFIGMNHGGLW
jgi:hypothetical protein